MGENDIDQRLYLNSHTLESIATLTKANFDETVKRNPTLKGMYRAINRDFFNSSTSRFTLINEI